MFPVVKDQGRVRGSAAEYKTDSVVYWQLCLETVTVVAVKESGTRRLGVAVETKRAIEKVMMYLG